MEIRPKVPELSDAAILIAGGTSGVGLAAARKFAEAGARGVAIVGRDTARGQGATLSLSQDFAKTEFLFVQGDANRAADASRICETVFARYGAIDVLLNSTVGPDAPALFKKLPIERLEAILVQQAMGPILMSRAALPYMVDAGGGVILNIASDAAKLATPGETVIGAAMAAIVMFTRALAIEAKRDGIRVNALTPSLIEGTMTNARMREDPFAARLFEKAATLAHLGVAQAEDLADLAVFLASPAARRITGQAISANGGISAA